MLELSRESSIRTWVPLPPWVCVVCHPKNKLLAPGFVDDREALGAAGVLMTGFSCFVFLRGITPLPKGSVDGDC